MTPLSSDIDTLGFARVPAVFNAASLAQIQTLCPPDSHGIREFLTTHPDCLPAILTPNLVRLVHQLIGPKAFLTKSIYFNKPASANWFVPYHQDLSITVEKKISTAGYGHWTHKSGLTGVHPPVSILESILTVRLHLDPVTDKNGALCVIPHTHSMGIVRKEKTPLAYDCEVICTMDAGDVLLMKPLLMHASKRSTSPLSRRVIHLEFSDQELAGSLNWKERTQLPLA